MPSNDRDCPVHGGDGTGSETPESFSHRSGTTNGVSRRRFVRAALAAGGAGALSACIERTGTVDAPSGTTDSGGLPDRLFEWNEHLPHGRYGNPFLPGHQLLLFLDYGGDGAPTASDRETVEAAFRTLDRAIQWGVGDEFDPDTTDGILYMVGYSPSYFDRFDSSLPDGIDLQRPEAVLETLGETETTADGFDAVVVLTSDRVPVLLSAEQALRGRLDELNGEPVEAALTDVMRVVDRRTGFLGQGRPAEHLEADVPDVSPTAMGFKSSFRDNQASEDSVTIEVDPFAGGSTMHVSRLTFDLESWYDHDRLRRIQQMFSPHHDGEDIGDIGELLAGGSQISESDVERTEADASDCGVVGHTQKVAAARDDDFDPIILRRSEGVSTDLEGPSMNFISLQRGMTDFVETREAMNGDHVDADVCPATDGILDYIDVTRRATFLVPPRSQRALPTPQTEQER